MQYGVIMAGGAGTRLWPLSRGDSPSSLLTVVRGKSLLQLSYERLRGILPPERIFVCTGAQPWQRGAGEPAGAARRKTCSASRRAATPPTPSASPPPCCTSATRTPSLAIITADHVIEPVETFQEAMQTAFDVADEAAERAGHVRHRPDARPHRPRLHPARRAAAVEGQRSRVPACRRSRKSPTSRPPTVTSNPAATTGTAACSSGGATRC